MNKIVSLETAKKLEDIGWEKETELMYNSNEEIVPVINERIGLSEYSKKYDYYAPDIPELLKDLKHQLFSIETRDFAWRVLTDGVEKIEISNIELVEALAELYIKLNQ